MAKPKKSAKKNTINTKRKQKKEKKKPKLWGLETLTYNKAAQQYHDMDYIDKLNDEEKQWLSQFSEEYYNNTLNKDWRKNLHYKEQKKLIYDATNARNRDMFNKRYKYNENENGIGIPDHYSEFCNPEEANIEYIDLKRKIAKFIQEAKDSGLSNKEVEKLTKLIFDIE